MHQINPLGQCTHWVLRVKMHQINPLGQCTHWGKRLAQWVRESFDCVTQWGKKGVILATYDKLSSARARL
jgi:hypothetical protein